MRALEILSGFVPLVILVAIVWGVVRITGGRSGERRVDPAVSIRRLLLYGFVFIALIIGAVGIIELAEELADPDQRSNAALARALAFVIVGAPASAATLLFVDRRLGGNEEERTATAWTIYLNLTMVTTLILAMVEVHSILRHAFGDEDGPGLDWPTAVAAIVWLGLLSVHWFFAARHGIAGDFHLALGSVIGLLVLAAGAVGLLYVGADEVYTLVTDDPLVDREGPTVAGWLATLIVGAVVWSWYWVFRYRTSERTELWYVTVVPVGSLLGFVAAVSAAATILYSVLVWFLGDTGGETAVRHFDLLPLTSAILVTGVVAWLYHRWLMGAEPIRNDAVRAYDYLLAAAALVTAVVGVVVLLSILFAESLSDQENAALAGLTMLVIGAPLWTWFWTRLRQAVELDRSAELRSPLRRIYVFAIFGVGGIASLVALLSALTSTLEDVLDDNVTRRTLDDNRFGLAILVAVSGVAWYHFRLYRRERDEYGEPPPPPPTHRPTRVVLVGPEPELARELAAITGDSVTHWRPTGEAPVAAPPVDAGELAAAIRARGDGDLLVIVGEGGPVVIPFTAETHVP